MTMTKRTFQQLVSAMWPVALLVMIVFTPFAVKKSWQEHKAHDESR